MTSDANAIDFFQSLNWSYKESFQPAYQNLVFPQETGQPVLKKRVSYMRVLTVLKCHNEHFCQFHDHSYIADTTFFGL